MSIGNAFNTFFFIILLILVQLCVIWFTTFMGIVGLCSIRCYNTYYDFIFFFFPDGAGPRPCHS